MKSNSQKQQKPKDKPFKNISKYIKQKEYLSLIIILFVMLIITNIISMVSPQLTATLLDQYVETTEINRTYIYVFIGITIIATISALLQTYLTTLVGEKIGKDLRNRLTKKILNKEYSYIVDEKPSKLLTVVLSDVNYIKTTFIQVLMNMILAIFMLIGSTILMFSISPKISTYVVLIVPTLIISLLLILRKDFKVFKQAQKIRDRLNKVISENIKGSMLIRVFVSEKDEERKFGKSNEKSKNLGIKISKIFATAIPTVHTISGLAALVVLYFGGTEVINQTLTIGELTALNSYILIFTMPLIMIAMMTTALGQAMASLNRINKVLDSKDTFENGTKEIRKIEKIEVEELDLEIDEKQILKDINFQIKKGQKVGLIGLTGSGKSIFLKTLTRSLEPKKGIVKINGKDIKEYKIQDVRDLIGFSLQENFLITGSILENIIFDRNITKEKAIKAAEIAKVDEFALNFEKKYDHQVGERGTLLSGGQKQRIMIARALAKNPQVLILDDATSRLDVETESQIFENIKTEYPDLSIILVAQKISSIKTCDHIYIFEEGKIEGDGTHEELQRTSLLYKEIELTQQNYND